MQGSWCIDFEQVVRGKNLDLEAPGLRDHVAGVKGPNPNSNPAGLIGTAPTSTLLLFDEHENLITELGRERIINDPEGANFPWLPMVSAPRFCWCCRLGLVALVGAELRLFGARINFLSRSQTLLLVLRVGS